MNEFKVLVLEDSISDQLSIEMILDDFQGINIMFAKNSQEFFEITSKNKINLIILDIVLNESNTGLDLVAKLENLSAWLIVCSAHECKKYFAQLESFECHKFYIQKPIDEFVLKTYIDSFIYSHNSLLA